MTVMDNDILGKSPANTGVRLSIIRKKRAKRNCERDGFANKQMQAAKDGKYG